MMITLCTVFGFAMVVGTMRVNDWLRTRRPIVVMATPAWEID
jgi:hypothetical protein